MIVSYPLDIVNKFAKGEPLINVLYRSGYNKNELAQKPEISQSSLYNKLNVTDRFMLWEFGRVIQIMQSDEKQIMCLCA